MGASGIAGMGLMPYGTPPHDERIAPTCHKKKTAMPPRGMAVGSGEDMSARQAKAPLSELDKIERRQRTARKLNEASADRNRPKVDTKKAQPLYQCANLRF